MSGLSSSAPFARYTKVSSEHITGGSIPSGLWGHGGNVSTSRASSLGEAGVSGVVCPEHGQPPVPAPPHRKHALEPKLATAPEFHTEPPYAVPAVPECAFPPAPRSLPWPATAQPANERPPSPPLFELTLRSVGVPKLSASFTMLPPSTSPLSPVYAFPPSVWSSVRRFASALRVAVGQCRAGGGGCC